MPCPITGTFESSSLELLTLNMHLSELTHLHQTVDRFWKHTIDILQIARPVTTWDELKRYGMTWHNMEGPAMTRGVLGRLGTPWDDL